VDAAPHNDLPPLGERDFEALRGLVLRETGVSLADTKRMLVQTRLGRRVKALGLGTFERYLELLQGPDGADEYDSFVGAITTHTTHFWREAHHFEELRERVLEPALKSDRRKLRLWCAASSTGEEPWCLAMTVAETLGAELSRWDVRILATDIDEHSLETARRGIYKAEDLEAHPAKRKHFLKGVRSQAGAVRVRDSLRPLLSFRRMNLIEPDWAPKAKFDAIFIRNVLIYFSQEAQLAVVKRLAGFLAVGGILVLGHAESMVGSRAGLRASGRGVFVEGARP
jgi:chemotaxis protein methyltransferase CheR